MTDKLSTEQLAKIKATTTDQIQVEEVKTTSSTDTLRLAFVQETTSTIDALLEENKSKPSQSPLHMFSNMAAAESLGKKLKEEEMKVELAATKASGFTQGKTAVKSSTRDKHPVGITPPSIPGLPPVDPGSIPNDPDSMATAFQNWLNSLKASPSPDQLMAFLSWFMAALSKEKSGDMSPATAAVFNKFFNQLSSITGSNGETLAELMVDTLRDLAYKNGGADAAKEAMQKLSAYFDQMKGENSFANQIAFWADHENKGIDSWIKKQQEDPMDPDDFDYFMVGQMLSFFEGNKDLHDLLHKIFMDEVNSLVKRFKKNPAVLITLIFATMGQTMSNMQYSYGGYGFLNKYLSDVSKKMADIQKEFAQMGTKDGISSKDLQKMTDEMTHLMYEVKQLQGLFGSNIVSTTDSSFSQFMKTKIDDQGHTMEDFLKDPSISSWDKVDQYFKDHKTFYQPGSTTQGKEKPSGPTDITRTIQQAMQAASTAYSSQAQTISIKMKELSSQIQSLISEIKSIVITNYSQGWIGAEVRNQKPA